MFNLKTLLWAIIAVLFLILFIYGRKINTSIKDDIDYLENIRDKNGNIIASRDFTGLNTFKLLGDSISSVSNVGGVGCVLPFCGAVLSTNVI